MANNKKFITLDNLKKFVKEFKKSNIAGSAIVDVNELPTSNIDDSKIYRLVTDIPEQHNITHNYRLFDTRVFNNDKAPGSAEFLENLNQWGLIENEDYFSYSLAAVDGYGSQYVLVYYDFIKTAEAEWNSGNTLQTDFVRFQIVEDANEFEALYNELISKSFNESQEYKDSLADLGATKYIATYVYIKNTTGLYDKDFLDTSTLDDNDQIPNIWEIDIYANPEDDYYNFDSIGPAFGQDWVNASLIQSYSSDLPIPANSEEPKTYKVIDFITEINIDSVHTEVLYIRDNNAWKELGRDSSIINVSELPTKDIDSSKIYCLITDIEGKNENKFYAVERWYKNDQLETAEAGFIDWCGSAEDVPPDAINGIDYFVHDDGDSWLIVYDRIKFHNFWNSPANFHILDNTAAIEPYFSYYESLNGREATQEELELYGNKTVTDIFYIKNISDADKTEMLNAGIQSDIVYIDRYIACKVAGDEPPTSGNWEVNMNFQSLCTNAVELEKDTFYPTLVLESNTDFSAIKDLYTEHLANGGEPLNIMANVVVPEVHTKALYVYGDNGWQKLGANVGNSSIGLGAIIDADELPTEDIDRSRIYRIEKTVTTTTLVPSVNLAHKVFVAGYYTESRRGYISDLENNLSSIGLVKNKDYFEFLRPTNPYAELPEETWDTYIVLFDAANFYKKMLQMNEESIVNFSDVTYHEVADGNEYDDLRHSLEGSIPTEEELNAGAIRLGFIHLAEPQVDFGDDETYEVVDENDNYWVNLYAYALTIDQKAGVYTIANIDSIGNAAELLNNFGLYSLEEYRNNCITLDTAQDFEDFADVYANLISSLDEPWTFIPRHLWVNAQTMEEHTEVIDQSGLYTYEKSGWKKLGGNGSSEAADINYATDDEIGLIFGTISLTNVKIKNNTLIVGDDITIDDRRHLLDLDGGQ